MPTGFNLRQGQVQLVTGDEIQKVIAHAYGAEPQVLARAKDLMKVPEK
jgi:hypothetical protein